MMIQTNGVLGDNYSIKDWVLTSGDKLPDLKQQDEIYYEYNQGKSNDCTIYSAMGAVSDLWNYEFSESEIKDINELSYKRGRIRGDGWYVNMAVDCVRDWWNSNKELVKRFGKIASYRVDLINDELVQEILDKGYTLCSGYNGSSEYNVDYYKDGVLNGNKFGKITYRHAVSWRKINGNRCIKDNYKGTKYKGELRNIYKVVPSCSDLVYNNVYFPNSYLFTKVAEDNWVELSRLEKVKSLCNNVLKANSELWNGTNSKELQTKLHDISEYIRNNNLRYIEETTEKLR